MVIPLMALICGVAAARPCGQRPLIYQHSGVKTPPGRAGSAAGETLGPRQLHAGGVGPTTSVADDDGRRAGRCPPWLRGVRHVSPALPRLQAWGLVKMADMST